MVLRSFSGNISANMCQSWKSLTWKVKADEGISHSYPSCCDCIRKPHDPETCWKTLQISCCGHSWRKSKRCHDLQKLTGSFCLSRTGGSSMVKKKQQKNYGSASHFDWNSCAKDTMHENDACVCCWPQCHYLLVIVIILPPVRLNLPHIGVTSFTNIACVFICINNFCLYHRHRGLTFKCTNANTAFAANKSWVTWCRQVCIFQKLLHILHLTFMHEWKICNLLLTS